MLHGAVGFAGPAQFNHFDGEIGPDFVGTGDDGVAGLALGVETVEDEVAAVVVVPVALGDEVARLASDFMGWRSAAVDAVDGSDCALRVFAGAEEEYVLGLTHIFVNGSKFSECG